MANRYQRRLPPPKPPPKWQTKALTTNNKNIYSIKNGKVLAVSIDNIQSIKKSVSDVARGKFYCIDMPETLVKKYTEPQTKLWFYDKKNFSKRPSSAPLNPTFETEESIFIPDDTLVKTPVPPNTAQKLAKTPVIEDTPEEKLEPEPVPLPAINQRPITPVKNIGLNAEAPFFPPIKQPSKSLYTLQSINKSIKKYRF